MNIQIQSSLSSALLGMNSRSYASSDSSRSKESYTSVKISDRVKSYKESDALRGLENGNENSDSVRRFRDSFDNAVGISAAATSKGIKAIETSRLFESSVTRDSAAEFVKDSTPEIMISISSSGKAAIETLKAMAEVWEENKPTEAAVTFEYSPEDSEFNRTQEVNSQDAVTKSAVFTDNISEGNASTTNRTPGIIGHKSGSSAQEKSDRFMTGTGNGKASSTAIGRMARGAYNFQMNFRLLEANLR